jgi:hypothetical protein
MKRVVSAMVVLGFFAGLVLADEIRAVITKVEGDKVTFYESKGKGEKGDEKTLPVAKEVKIVKGKFNKDTKKVEAGDKIDDGLKDKTFTSIGEKGVRALVITDDENKSIKEIRVFGGKKKAE